MAEKSLDVQIADKEAEIVKLRAEQEALRVKALPEYPKHLKIKLADGERGGLRDADGDGYYIVEVKNEEEEKAALASPKKGKAKALPADSVTSHKAEDDNKAKNSGTVAGRK